MERFTTLSFDRMLLLYHALLSSANSVLMPIRVLPWE